MNAVPKIIPMEAAQPLPSAPDMEQAVLGALLVDNKAIYTVGDILRPEMFHVNANAYVYAAITAMFDRGDPIDILTVARELRLTGRLDAVGGHLYIAKLTGVVASSAHIQFHALVVVEQFIAREQIRLGSEIQRSAYAGEDVFDTTAAAIAKLEANIASGIKRGSVPYGEAEGDELRRMDEPRKASISTGFDALDSDVGGFRRGDLAVIAARPGMGKSSLAFSSALKAAQRGHKTAVLSLEIGQEVGQARLFSARSGIPVKDILQGRLTTEQVARRHALAGEGERLPLWMHYGGGMSLTDIRAEAVRLVRQHDVGCIFIDQLNWIKPPKAQNKDTAVGEITRRLKNLAQELDIAVVLMHQLNRDVEKRGASKRPQLSDLRDSGNVEQDAQLVLFVYRPEYYGITEDSYGSTIGKVQVIVAKNSNGPTTTVPLRFDGPSASVHDIQPEFTHASTGDEPF